MLVRLFRTKITLEHPSPVSNNITSPRQSQVNINDPANSPVIIESNGTLPLVQQNGLQSNGVKL